MKTAPVSTRRGAFLPLRRSLRIRALTVTLCALIISPSAALAEGPVGTSSSVGLGLVRDVAGVVNTVVSGVLGGTSSVPSESHTPARPASAPTPAATGNQIIDDAVGSVGSLVAQLLGGVLPPIKPGPTQLPPAPLPNAIRPLPPIDRTGRTPDPAKVDALVAKAAAAGTVPVIVGLRTVTVPDGVLDEAGRAVQREQLRALREAVKASLSATSYQVIREYETIPFLALEVGPAALGVLRTSPHVASIREDQANVPSLQESNSIVEAQAVWPQARGSAQMVAVLDTGLDNTHPFLGGRVTSEACFASDESCFSGQDSGHGPGASLPCAHADCKHGMHVAGIVAGFESDAYSGIAPSAQIVSVRVFRDDVTASDSDVLRGLEHVYNLRTINGFPIASVNMSLGSGIGYDRSACDSVFDDYKEVIDNLIVKGVSTVVASGNDGFVDAMNSPACLSNVISVGNTTKPSMLGDPAPESVNTSSNSAAFLDLLAPGTGIQSSVLGGKKDTLSGTSMAAPHVAGAIALLKELVPYARQDYFLWILRATGQPVTDGRNNVTTPRIRIGAAVKAIANGQSGATNNFFANQRQLLGYSGTVVDSNVLGAAPESGEPAHDGNAGGSSVWFSWRPHYSGTMTLTTRGSSFDTVLAVYTGSSVNSLTRVASNDDANGSSTSEVQFAVDDRTTYRIAVDGYNWGSGPALGAVTLTYTVSPPANDDRAGAQRLGTRYNTNGAITQDARGATFEPGEDLDGGGGHTLWFTWSSIAAGETATFSTAGSNYDTILTIWKLQADAAGTTVNSVGTNDNFGGGPWSLMSFSTEANNVLYLIRVDAAPGKSPLELKLSWGRGTPTVSIADDRRTEGSNSFTVTLSQPSEVTVTVDFATAPGTAGDTGQPPAKDFNKKSETLTLWPGESSRPIHVGVIDDKSREPDETFTVTLKNPVNATIGRATATGTIVDNDPVPGIRTASVDVTEPDYGQVDLVFPIRLSEPSSFPVSVDARTRGGLARGAEDNDYRFTSTRVYFAPGVTYREVRVPVLGDTAEEESEDFALDLSNPSGATLVHTFAYGRIVNDDPPPTVRISSPVTTASGVYERARFEIELSADNPYYPVAVSWTTEDGTAKVGSDYRASSGTAFFYPDHEPRVGFEVEILPHVLGEGPENFRVKLTVEPSSVAVENGGGVATILPPGPQINVETVHVTEGARPAEARFRVHLSEPWPEPVTIDYTAAEGGANRDDFVPVSGSLTIPAGSTEGFVWVTVLDDRVDEFNESFRLLLTRTTAGNIGRGAALGTIVDDDPAPSVTVTDPSVVEGDPDGSTPRVLDFRLMLSAPSTKAPAVWYQLENVTTSDSDYRHYWPQPNRVIFEPGQTVMIVRLFVNSDDRGEINETVRLKLFAPDNLVIAREVGTGTIVDDDCPANQICE